MDDVILESPGNDKNNISIKEYFNSQTRDLKEFFNIQINEIKDSVKVALASLNERLEGMNEFRDTLRDQAGKFETRTEVEPKLTALEDKIEVKFNTFEDKLTIIVKNFDDKMDIQTNIINDKFKNIDGQIQSFQKIFWIGVGGALVLEFVLKYLIK